MIWFDLIQFNLVWLDLIWFNLVWFDLIWFDLIWYDIIWYNIIWFDLLIYCNAHGISVTLVSQLLFIYIHIYEGVGMLVIDRLSVQHVKMNIKFIQSLSFSMLEQLVSHSPGHVRHLHGSIRGYEVRLCSAFKDI